MAGRRPKSIVMAHQRRTISKQRLGGLFGYPDDAQLRHEIHRAVKEHSDLV